MNYQKRIGFLFFTLCLLVGPTHGKKLANVEVEEIPLLAARDVLPDELVSSDYYQVQDGVKTYDSLHLFLVDTEFGRYEVYGEPLLRVRLRETFAITKLKKTSGTKAAASAAGSEAIKGFKFFGKAITSPVKTAKGVPSGVKRLFKSVGYDIKDAQQDSKDIKEEQAVTGAKASETAAADRVARKWGNRFIGVEKSHRDWAKKLGVDPYSTNPLLQQELKRVAQADTAARIGTSLIMPSMPEAFSLIADVSETVWERDWRELLEISWKLLEDIDVPEETIEAFFLNEAHTPSVVMLLVATLARMDGVADRPIVIEQAAQIKDEHESLFFTESLMIAGYAHTHGTSLARMLPGSLILVALTQKGDRLIAFTAADYTFWSEQTAKTAIEFAAIYEGKAKHLEVWVADQTTPSFAEAVANLGWSMQSGLRSGILPVIPWGMSGDRNPTD